MINLELAPPSGRVLVYTPDRLIYDGYRMQDGDVILHSGEVLDFGDAFVIHLFDEDTELRAICEGGIWTVSAVRAQDEIEDEDHFVFSESQFVRERYWVDAPNEKIVVHNHFSFNEDGFLQLDGYRLAMESEAKAAK